LALRKNRTGQRFERLRFAACAPFLPSAVRTDFGRCAMVRFFLAALAAFLMFLRTAALCLDGMIPPAEWLSSDLLVTSLH